MALTIPSSLTVATWNKFKAQLQVCKDMEDKLKKLATGAGTFDAADEKKIQAVETLLDSIESTAKSAKGKINPKATPAAAQYLESVADEASELTSTVNGLAKEARATMEIYFSLESRIDKQNDVIWPALQAMRKCGQTASKLKQDSGTVYKMLNVALKAKTEEKPETNGLADDAFEAHQNYLSDVEALGKEYDKLMTRTVRDAMGNSLALVAFPQLQAKAKTSEDNRKELCELVEKVAAQCKDDALKRTITYYDELANRLGDGT